MNDEKTPKPEITERTEVVRGIELPWERWTANPVFKDGKNLTPERPNPPRRLDSGVVFIEVDTLVDVAERTASDSYFDITPPFVGYHAELALVMAGLAEKETRGGLHGTKRLRKLLKKNGLI